VSLGSTRRAFLGLLAWEEEVWRRWKRGFKEIDLARDSDDDDVALFAFAFENGDTIALAHMTTR
jgi:hypothetical protein